MVWALQAQGCAALRPAGSPPGAPRSRPARAGSLWPSAALGQPAAATHNPQLSNHTTQYEVLKTPWGEGGIVSETPMEDALRMG